MSIESVSSGGEIVQKEAGITQEHQHVLLVLLLEFDRVCRTLEIPYVLFAGTMLGAVRHQGFIPWDDDLDVMMLREDYERFLREADSVLDREKFFLQKEYSKHWPMYFSKLRMNGTTCLEKFHPRDSHIHQGIYIDIFPCDNAADGELGRRMQFCASKVVIAKCLDARGYDTDSKKKKIFMAFCRLLPMAPFLKLSKGRNRKGNKVHSFLGGSSGYAKSVYPRKYFDERIEAVFEGNTYPISEHYDALLQVLYGDYMRIPPPEERICKQHAVLLDFEHSYEMYQHYRDGMRFDAYTRSIR